MMNGGAESTAQALPCLDNFLVTQNQTKVHWDVILFNFGLHNLNDTTAQAQNIYRQQLMAITIKLLHNNNDDNVDNVDNYDYDDDDDDNDDNDDDAILSILPREINKGKRLTVGRNAKKKRPKLIYATTTPFMPLATKEITW